MTDPTRDLLISLASHMAYMQGQLEAHHQLDDLEDYYWYRESVALRQKVADALAGDPAAPAPPADGEVAELAEWLYQLADQRSCNRRRGIRPHPSALTRAAVLLQQQALVPVPVAERPWEREGWCDGSDRCWWLVPNQSWPCLYLMKIDSAIAAAVATHCLPAHALPLPEVGE